MAITDAVVKITGDTRGFDTKVVKETQRTVDRIGKAAQKTISNSLGKAGFSGSSQLAKALNAGIGASSTVLQSLVPASEKVWGAVSKGAKKSVSWTVKTIGNIFKTGLTTAGVAAGAVLGTALVKGWGRLRAIDTAQAKLKGLGIEGKQLESVMGSALEGVKGTMFGLGDAAGVAATMVASGIKPGTELTNTLKTISSAASVAGTDMNDVGAIFGKVAAQNKVSGEIVNQMTERQIPLLQYLAKEYGVSAEEAGKMVSAGEVDFKTFEKVMRDNLGGAAVAMGESFTGLASNVIASLGRMGAAVQQPIFDGLKNTMTDLLPIMGEFEDSMTPLGEIAANLLNPAFSLLNDWLKALDFEAVTKGVESATGGINPFVPLMQSVVDVIEFLARATVALGPALGAGIGGAASIFSALLGAVEPLLPILGAALTDALIQLIPSFVQLIEAITPLLPILVGELVPVLAQLVEWAAQLITWVAGVASEFEPFAGGATQAALAVAGLLLGVKAVTTALKLGKAAQVAWTVAAGTAAAGTKANTAAVVASWVAQKTWIVVTKAAAVAQRVFNTVMSANPILKIVTLVIALGTALWAFFTKTEAGRKILAVVFEAFRVGFEQLKVIFAAVVAAFAEGWEQLKAGFFAVINAFAVGWEQIKAGAMAVVGAFAQGWEQIKGALAGLRDFFVMIWDSIVGWVTEKIEQVKFIVLVGVTVLRSQWTAVWTSVKNFFINIWNSIVSWVTTKIAAVRRVISVATAAIRLGWQIIWNTIKNFFVSTWNSIVSWVTTKLAQVRTIISVGTAAVRAAWSAVWNRIREIFSEVWGRIKSSIQTMMDWVKTKPKEAFEKARDAIGKAWRGIQNLAKKPVKFVVNTVIGGLVDAVNLIPGVNVTKPKLPKGFARGGIQGGGIIPGYDPIARDTVLTPTRKGEAILVPEVTRALGASTINALNRAGNNGGAREVRAKFGEGRAKGGWVTPLPAGSYSVSQPFHSGHNGIDLAAATGTKVMAPAAGKVVQAGWEPGGSFGGGNQVNILHPGNILTWFAHLNSIAARVGQNIAKGRTLGGVGSTGNSTGPHLHYMIETGSTGALGSGTWINPAPYMTGHTTPKGDVGSGGGWNPLNGIIDTVADQIKKAFPEGGMWVDAAAGIAKETAEQAVKAFTPKIGKDDGVKGSASIRPTLFDGGGALQQGLQLVEHRRRKPDAVLTYEEKEGLKAMLHGGGRGFDGDVYVQNPWTGEYMRAEVRREADARIIKAGSGASRRALTERLGVK